MAAFADLPFELRHAIFQKNKKIAFLKKIARFEVEFQKCLFGRNEHWISLNAIMLSFNLMRMVRGSRENP